MTTLPEEAVKAAKAVLNRAQYVPIDQVEEALTAALPFLSVRGSVKKLEWGNARITEDGREAEDAESPVGRYIATDTGWFLLGRTGYEVERGLYQAKAAAQADYEARVRSAIETVIPVSVPSAARDLALEEGDLNARLKAKGMYSIDEMMGSLPLDKWRVHSGMTDLKFFGEWLERKTRDYCTMHAAYEVGDKDVSDELYEWVLAHYSAFHDVLVNFRAALSSPDHADAGKVEGDGIERAKFYHHQWPMERLLEARRGGLVDHSGGEAWRYEYSHKDEHGKYDILYRPVKNSTIPARLPSAPSEGAE